ncbi:hypothetical protein E1B28_003891 [Marasmius oreades]|uniref:DUF6534 domain-containing protein n=1 Tax=Marasmius oreades TaxID=181124 RepID=A0A9P7UXH1_9AGAR|nr:uncharacterized protein E1B28_003891 [Marasmius oreades]KAG7096457.1 hypothetical protein E1B28_003891 [Marasmius oreades]
MALNSSAVRGEDYIWLTLPNLLAFALNWCLLGGLIVQLYTYHITFRDRLWFKILVYSVFILDLAQTCSATYDAAQWFGFHWGDPSVLEKPYTTYLNVPLFTGIIGAAVQIFYGWRIWSLSKSNVLFGFFLSASNVLFGFIISMALTQLGGSIATAYFLSPHELGNSDVNIRRSVGVRLVTSAAVDIVIAGCMTYFLLKSRNSEFTMRTNAVLTKLVRLTVETGTITAAAAIIDLIFYLTLKHKSLHQLSGVNLSKLYTNSLLMLFNNRIQVQRDLPLVQDQAGEFTGGHKLRRQGWNVSSSSDAPATLETFQAASRKWPSEGTVDLSP